MTVAGTMLTDLRGAANNCAASTFHWRLDGHDGYGLEFALAGEADPPARLPSPVRGWHRVFLGFPGACGLRVRLEGDRWFRRVETSVRWDADASAGEELFWCGADLTDAVFEFLPQALLNRADRRRSCLAYLRVESLPGGPPSSSHTSTTRTAGAVIDGHELLGAYAPTTPDDVRGMIAPFVDSDFRRLHFGCTCTTMRMVYLTHVEPADGPSGARHMPDLRAGSRRPCRSRSRRHRSHHHFR